ncbi:hypothetical protein GmHk_13G036551 [Glycine max]|nr:hypothetical protein GmHk_13G036551 [Glycine max]
MATSPVSPPPPPPSSSPPPPPPSQASTSPSTVKQTHKATHLRSLATRPPGAERLVVNVDPDIGKTNGPHKKKLRTYLRIVARDKVDVTYETWKEVPIAQKDLIWEDIQDGVADTVCEKYGISKDKWSQFCKTRRDPSWEDVRKKAQAIQKQNTALHVLSCGGYEYLEEKLISEKTKKKLEEVARGKDVVIDPSSPIRHHVKWKMARTKKTGQMTSESAKEIAQKIDSLEEQASQGSFVPHGRQDVLTAAIGPRATDPTNQGPARGVNHKKVTQQLLASFSQMQSQLQSHMQSQGLVLPPKPEVGPSRPHVSTKRSYVDPLGNDPKTGDSDKCGLYIEANHPRPVALGRLYEGSIVHNIPLLPGQVKVGFEEVKVAQVAIPVPTDEVTLSEHISVGAAVSATKPPPRPDPEVDDPLYLMMLTIPELFLKPFQVNWDSTVFEVFNPDFPLYIKHEDLSEIAHGGQCLNIYVIQLWILALKGLDDTPQPKSKVAARWIVVKCNRQKGSTECSYYVMHWMSTIILGSFRNNWETYFNDARPLEPKRLKALYIQWAQYYLRLRHQT